MERRDLAFKGNDSRNHQRTDVSSESVWARPSERTTLVCPHLSPCYTKSGSVVWLNLTPVPSYLPTPVSRTNRRYPSEEPSSPPSVSVSLDSGLPTVFLLSSVRLFFPLCLKRPQNCNTHLVWLRFLLTSGKLGVPGVVFRLVVCMGRTRGTLKRICSRTWSGTRPADRHYFSRRLPMFDRRLVVAKSHKSKEIKYKNYCLRVRHYFTRLRNDTEVLSKSLNESIHTSNICIPEHKLKSDSTL